MASPILRRVTMLPMHDVAGLDEAKRRLLDTLVEKEGPATRDQVHELQRLIVAVTDAEARRVALVEIVAAAKQGTVMQNTAFTELMPDVLADLDRHSRRSYLPPDESHAAAVDALVRLRDKNFASLREFLEARRRKPERLLTNWLRKGCAWAVSHRLRRLSKSGLLAGDETSLTAIAQKESSTTLVFDKVMRVMDERLRWDDDLRWKLYSDAEAQLSDDQRRALRTYFAMLEGTLPKSADTAERDAYEAAADALGTHERTRSAYERIAGELELLEADGKAPWQRARRVVTTAKQALKRAIETLSDGEAHSAEEEE